MKVDTSIRSADIDLGFFDLNTASEKDISDIPGIGPELAQAIVEHRPFDSVEDMARVPGITQDNVDDLLRYGATVGTPNEEVDQVPAED